jgi:Domain of unknown function (DUF5668)/B-box zinc finger
MNCANHADASAVAYCRTCGKALCANCTRPVRGVIYCEDCLGAKMEGSAAGTTGFVSGGFSPTTFSPAASGQVPPPPPPPGSGSGPNPTVAGILAGFFPFGVGAVYTGQYAKGLAHLAIFVLLIAGCNSGGDVLPAISGIGIAFFVVYQIIDAVRSARAIQAGLPAPDPYGLGATFGGGAKIETSKIPMGAVVLILLGVLFLLHTMGFAEYGMDRFWPLILIALGAWLFARNWGLLGSPMCSGCQCARCRSRRVMGPAMLLTIGFLFLLQALHGPSFWHGTWPVVLLVIGGVKLLQGSASAADHIPSSGPGAPGAIPPNVGGPIPPVPPVPPVPPTSEVNRG